MGNFKEDFEKGFKQGFDSIFEDMVDETASAMSEEEEIEEKKSFVSTLRKVNDFLLSRKFNKFVSDKAKQCKVNDNIIKNIYAKNILDNIGKTLGVTIELVGNIFSTLIKFIGWVIINAVKLTSKVLQKIVNVITFRTIPA